jgi:hypothetical protein
MADVMGNSPTVTPPSSPKILTIPTPSVIKPSTTVPKNDGEYSGRIFTHPLDDKTGTDNKDITIAGIGDKIRSDMAVILIYILLGAMILVGCYALVVPNPTQTAMEVVKAAV